MSKLGFRRALEKIEEEVRLETSVRIAPKNMLELYAWLVPEYEYPAHLQPFIDSLERAVLYGGVQMCLHAPPQHSKTETAILALVWASILQRDHPKKVPPTHAYSTFNDDRAGEVLRKFCAYAERAGLKPQSRDTVVNLEGGTQIKFSRNITGTPIRRHGLHIVDDPVKDLEAAVSKKQSEELKADFRDVYLGRAHPGASLIVIMHRWSPDDLIGWLVRDYGWHYVRLAAICDSPNDPLGREIGQPLWLSEELGRTLEWYRQKEHQVGARTWASLWQGDPRPEGGALFSPCTYYDAFPPGPYSLLYGMDLAYQEKSRSDHSVLIQARYYHWSQGIYLTHILREQVQADVFNAHVRDLVSREPGPLTFIGAPVEEGTARLLAASGLPTLQFVNAQRLGDKYARAWPVAEKMWNPPCTRIFVPRLKPWTQAFAAEVENFDGRRGGQDDQVDALVALVWPILRGGLASTGVEWSGQMKRLAERFAGQLRGRGA